MKDEFKITYSRGSGPGGQRKNKVETCVEIEHLETGMKERCQDTPSRARNQAIAIDRLTAKIQALREQEKAEAINNARAEQIKTQTPIRTYNYKMGVVIDHRTGKRASLKSVLNGALNLLR